MKKNEKILENNKLLSEALSLYEKGYKTMYIHKLLGIKISQLD